MEAARDDRLVALSAVTGQGTDTLLALIDERLSHSRITLEITLPISDGATIAWLYRKGEVLSRQDDDEAVTMLVRLDPADAGRFQQGQQEDSDSEAGRYRLPRH